MIFYMILLCWLGTENSLCNEDVKGIDAALYRWKEGRTRKSSHEQRPKERNYI
jgi:hypothetical protein